MRAEDKERKKGAAALSYEAEEDVAPRIVAKGRGIIAEKIIELAREHGVPLYEDRTLVELLLKLDLGEYIPHELYQAVAEVLVFIYKLEQRAKSGRILLRISECGFRNAR
ncbi:MAG: EscU/YscU/HrcU family type III secretion system export apparatus switch protein [bacterium]